MIFFVTSRFNLIYLCFLGELVASLSAGVLKTLVDFAGVLSTNLLGELSAILRTGDFTLSWTAWICFFNLLSG